MAQFFINLYKLFETLLNFLPPLGNIKSAVTITFVQDSWLYLGWIVIIIGTWLSAKNDNFMDFTDLS